MDLSNYIQLKPSGSNKYPCVNRKTLEGKQHQIPYHKITALLFGAPNNSGFPFDDNLGCDHIMEGEEGRGVEMSLKITNLQFLTSKQNLDKYKLIGPAALPPKDRQTVSILVYFLCNVCTFVDVRI